MSADIIQAQYDQLEALARRFGKQADLQIALQKRVQTNATRLRTAWVGRGSDAFFAEMDGKVFPAMQRLIAALREADRVTRQMSELVHQAEDEASRLFGQVDQQGGGISKDSLQQGSPPLATPAPTPAPSSVVAREAPSLSVESAIKNLDDILKPIDWLSGSKSGSKTFDETLKEIGRILNTVTGERGHVKMMSELGDTLTGVSKVVGGVSDVLTLHDFGDYFAGKLTNQQVADSAVKALIPIPILNDKIAAWIITNMPDPDGKWGGLVRSAQ